jgi:2-polyprenyl-3-methyl-5-hydroxy-6-metoxy-1,4-benzoquinol methylase
MPVQERYPDYIEDQRKFFDELITEDWQSYYNKEWDISRRFEIACLFEKIRPARILDLGCGVGFHDQVMAEYPFVSEVHAVDYSAKSIEKANANYPHPKVTRWTVDFLHDHICGEYDLVVSFQVFEHLKNPFDYFRVAKALCRDSGLETSNRTLVIPGKSIGIGGGMSPL